ncbi:unnamed protein product, partial [marine sediment metagenome]
TYNQKVSSINILKDIFKFKTINNNKTNLIDLDKLFENRQGDSSKEN